MLNIGVIGAGHLGKIHLKLINDSKYYNLIGFYDEDEKNSSTIVNSFNYKFFSSPEKLIKNCDVIDIVTPTESHHEFAIMAIKNKCHVFIEKPITKTITEAREIIKLADYHKVLGQVGHVERFNPALIAAKTNIIKPMFIESHRLSQFNPRGTDVPVVLDLMIHDIDIILNTVNSQVKSISASGVKVVSNTPDISNARIEFENGCVANLTASRISLKNMRKTRFFQRDAYVSVDFLNKTTEIVKIKDLNKTDKNTGMILENSEGIKRELNFEKPTIFESNAILDELESFARSIINQKKPVVDLMDGYLALKTAQKIIDSY
tara:strand:+ start:7680 stop:8639 length:960 start_codon:yes stop_codon:yes gene_type:complete